MTQAQYARWVTIVRWLLGLQFLLSGLNWFVKMLPYPNMFDDRSIPLKYKVVEHMIATGWMFQLAKCIEVLTGLALVSNRYVPLLLAASMSVTLTTFLMDVWNWAPLTDWIAGTGSLEGAVKYLLDALYFGGAVLLMQGFLMLSYLPAFAPMLRARVEPQAPFATREFNAAGSVSARGGHGMRRFMIMLLVLALLSGVTSTGWLIGMVKQWLIPWSSFAIFLQPRG
jgi:uncharacterized membrane protein YphA (DoxX/SURF4 family)